MSDETKAIEETAKAAQEVAKATSQAIEATRDVGGWLDRVFGQAIEQTVGRFWTDRVRASRIAAAIYDWERLTTLLSNTEKKLQKKGVARTRIVPPKIALPLLEHATMENEDELHELWENLLASALDPSEDDVRRTYVSVLSEMSGNDAHSLRHMYAEWLFWEEHQRKEGRSKESRYASGIGTQDDASAVLFHRLGLILPAHVVVEEYRRRRPVTLGGHDDELYVEAGEVTQVLGDLSAACFTEFGERFCHAVMGDVSGLYEPPGWMKPKSGNQ